MNVVFPAPLGPISPTISPWLMVMETVFTALRPPNCLVNRSVSKITTDGSFFMRYGQDRGSLAYLPDREDEGNSGMKWFTGPCSRNRL